MVSVKKTTLALLTLSVSGIAAAGMYTPPSAAAPTTMNATTPTIAPWGFDVQGLYLQSNKFEAITDSEHDSGLTAPGLVVNTPYQSLDPEWAWGFRLAVFHRIGCSGKDVNLNWTHFDNDADPQSVSGNNTTVFIGTAFLPDPQIAPSWTSATASMDNDFDQVNIEFGQSVLFGQHALVRFHGGLAYARIKQDITQSGSVAVDGNGENFATDDDSKFNGVGPRAGMDIEYGALHDGWLHGFSIVGGVAGSLFVGTRDYDNTTADNLNGNTTFGGIDSSSRIIVPGAEARLGLKYAHPTQHGNIGLEAGYQVNEYWNSVQHLIAEPNQPFFATQNNDFGFQGVYLGISWAA